MIFTITLGLIAATAGCISLYLSSPHQRWRQQPWSAQPARSTGLLLLALSLTLLWQAMQAVAAVFTLLHWAMLLFILFPYLGALFTLRRKPT